MEERNEAINMKQTSMVECGDQPDRTLIEREERPRSSRPAMDVNLYAAKKTVAQGMMDIALLTANASQLKYVLREGENDKYYLLNVTCLSVSISLQIIVGVLLVLNNRYNINMTAQQHNAELLNNLTIIGIFLITVVNVFISAFGTSH
ncbi:ninjurin-2-like [Centruroides sculpturatus]|uniref:ninjurin-2-like n=1 Tax=Centruroides sculpturatus TaxID=218467 RepID=UPI000C6EC4B1|nr:ninjurin-2-like [Centruroides sculpturatus]